ncbi:MAG: hypothetical protein NTW87_16440 [Planctomycetota bacterium]|nr:hypothetical protein [Planctomycetota bacterium]
MMRLINEQLGRLLLVVAACAAVAVTWSNRPQPLPEVEPTLLHRQVRVELDKNALAAASTEVFYAPDDGMQWAGPDRYVFTKPKVVREYQAVELSLPSAGVKRPPQLLPEPGPSLEGTDKLPRFGDEFPPIIPPADVRPPPRATVPGAADPRQPGATTATAPRGPGGAVQKAP